MVGFARKMCSRFMRVSQVPAHAKPVFVAKIRVTTGAVMLTKYTGLRKCNE